MLKVDYCQNAVCVSIQNTYNCNDRQHASSTCWRSCRINTAVAATSLVTTGDVVQEGGANLRMSIRKFTRSVSGGFKFEV
jgi:hypothetical protein